jgi:hypothetical protein
MNGPAAANFGIAALNSVVFVLNGPSVFGAAIVLFSLFIAVLWNNFHKDTSPYADAIETRRWELE